MHPILEAVVRTATTVGPTSPTTVPGQSGTGLLGPNFMEFLILALGAALVVGNVGALLRPRTTGTTKKGELQRAPMGRSLVMAGIGAVAALWALASLLT